MEPVEKIIKVILIGNGRVGKTMLRRKYMGETFTKEYMMTIGADFAVKRMRMGDSNIALQIWDLAGQKQFSFIRDRYYKNVSGMMIVFDLTDKKSFDDIPNWIHEYLDTNENNLIPIILIGNKLDLATEGNRNIKAEEVNNYIETLKKWGKETNENFNVHYIETSALYGENVNSAFESIISSIREFRS